MTDPLAALLDLHGVADAAREAQDAVDRMFSHRTLRRSSGPVAAESALRGARASAALEGAAYDLDAVRAGTVTDPVLQGALRVAGAAGALADTWARAPRQALASLHLLAARDLVPETVLGRPDGAVDVAAVAGRLDGLTRLAHGRTAAPPVVVAAVVHGELLTMRPFAGPNGVVARAAGRLVLASGGLGPWSVAVPEVGHLAREPEYVGAAGAYATGTPDGVRAWLVHCCTALSLGAKEGLAICDEREAGSARRAGQ